MASLRPELRDALRGIGPGQLTAVVRIPSGYAVMRLMPDTEPTTSVDASPSRMLAVSATGATRDALPVSGLIEADTIFLNGARGR